jgi:hypothetical protein
VETEPLKNHGNKKANEPAKNAIAKDINDRKLYPPQDQIDWMKKSDEKNRQER